MHTPNTNIVISRDDISLPKAIEKEAGTLILDGFFRGKIIPGYTNECSRIIRDKKWPADPTYRSQTPIWASCDHWPHHSAHPFSPAKFLEGKPGSLCLECDVWVGKEANIATLYVEYSIFTSEDWKRFVQRKVDSWVNNSGQDDILETMILPLFAVEKAAIGKHLQG
jgi:hypothetical protein